MAHFAKVENGLVTDVIVVTQEVINSGEFGEPSLWVQCSYNTHGGVHYGADGQPDGLPALRKNYPAIGWDYSTELDAFIPPKPYPSWVLNTQTCLYDPPTPQPECPYPDNEYVWDETAWDETGNGWVLRYPQ